MAKSNSEAENEVYRFIKILIIVVIFIVGAYFLTNKIVGGDYDIKKDGQKGEISTNNIIVGSLLNRPYDTYYALAYKSKDNDAVVYETYLRTYESKEESLRIYFIDLDNSLNKDYYTSDSSNPKATKIEDLKISAPTLIKVKDGKIIKYIEGKSEIKKELGI